MFPRGLDVAEGSWAAERGTVRDEIQGFCTAEAPWPKLRNNCVVFLEQVESRCDSCPFWSVRVSPSSLDITVYQPCV